MVFETDCLVLKQALVSTTYDYSRLGILLSELKYKLCLRFIEARIMHVQRTCNKPTHVLASLGVDIVNGEHSIWMSNYSSIVAREVTGDLAVS